MQADVAAEPAAGFLTLSLLAVVQGVAEFLPISSKGHLVLAQSALEFPGPALSADVALHIGTLVSVLIVYRKDLASICADALRGSLREPLLLALATIPAAVAGLWIRDRIRHLYESPRAAALGLLGTAGILLVGEWGRRRNAARVAAVAPNATAATTPSLAQALAIGCAQMIALLPGVSRSGTTIACGLVLGLPPAAAARFSFLLSIPAVAGAAVLEAPDALRDSSTGGAPLVWAVAIAGLVGWAALRVLLAFLGRGAFAWFAAYCFALGAGVLVFL